MTIPINYWAILVSMVISILLGFLWYGPLFGKQWMAGNGMKMPDKKPGFSTMIRPMILSLIGVLFLGFAMNHSLVFANAYFKTSGVTAGLMAAFWNWLGFI